MRIKLTKRKRTEPWKRQKPVMKEAFKSRDQANLPWTRGPGAEWLWTWNGGQPQEEGRSMCWALESQGASVKIWRKARKGGWSPEQRWGERERKHPQLWARGRMSKQPWGLDQVDMRLAVRTVPSRQDVDDHSAIVIGHEREKAKIQEE